MAQTVIAFVGENANGILETQSRRFHELLEPLGLEGQVLHFGDPDIATRIKDAVACDIAFAWGYAGVGARLAVGSRNLWDALQVPFVSVLADAPYIMPANHCIPTPWVVNGYVYREWLQLQQTHFRSNQISAHLSMGVIPNPNVATRPHGKRPTRMLFVKTGADPAAIEARWSLWPARLQPILGDCAATLARMTPQPLAPLVLASLAAHDLALDGSKPLLFGLMHELDTYIRALRATTMARALLALPVDIVGDGWAHVADAGGRARFHASVNAAALDAMYADARILVNVTPNLASGAHERVLRGFAAQCRVVSDDNDHVRTALHHLPSYHPVTWHAHDLADQVAAIFNDPAPFDDRLEAATDHVARHHDPTAFLQRMVGLAELARAQTNLACYALEAA